MCLRLEPALHAFCEIAVPTFSLTASVPAYEMAPIAFGSWKPSNALNITCNACINHNAHVPEPLGGRRRERPGNLSLYSPSMSSCSSPKITLFSFSQSSWEYKSREEVICESSVIPKAFGCNLFVTHGKKKYYK